MNEMMRIPALLGFGAAVAAAAGWVAADQIGRRGGPPPIAQTLDDFHKAAAAADEARYFGHFAPGAVFLGTDPTERWTLEEFRAWARPHFESGTGWAYEAVSRHVNVSSGGDVGWFDEVVRNARYGDLRGTGVVVLINGEWKIAQYNLTFMIPNEDAAAVLELIEEGD